MWRDIINGKINMVAVKDLSRLGREHIQTDAYIQKIFPSLGVRFLAVMDSYDSLYAKEGEKQFLIPIKNFINDQYARDISIKIRSSQEAMRKEGLCTGAIVPYGYQKENKKLFPDQTSAVVVRLIFLKKLEGESAKKIAEDLNGWGIPSPTEYRREKGSSYYSGFQCQEVAKWSGMSVAEILKNHVYIGILEQGKRMRISYKVRKVVAVPKEKWSIVKGAHQAIISKEEFDLVSQLSSLDLRRAPGQTELYPFSGLLFCGDCKRAMIRRTGYGKKGRACYLCSNYNKGNGCTRHTIFEDVLFALIQIIFQNDRKAVQIAWEESNLKRKQKEESFWKDLIQKNQERERKYQYRINQAEKDFQEGKIGKKEWKQYQAVYLKQIEWEKKAVLLCEQELKHQKRKEDAEEIILSHSFLVWLIKRIEIYDGKKVKIQFRFLDGSMRKSLL